MMRPTGKGSETGPTAFSSDGSRGVPQKRGAGSPMPLDLRCENILALNSGPSRKSKVGCAEKRGPCGDSKAELDGSLTNIQWLGRLSSWNLIPNEENSSEVESVKPPRSSSKDRPPYSYLQIIQLAINGSQTRKMTLQEIYTWVEEHFPYYKYVAKPGWKNSIRHNLSIHKKFVRQRGNNGKAMYWTIKPSCHQSPCSSLSKQAGQEKDLAILQRSGSKDTVRRVKPILPQRCSAYPVSSPVFITVPVLYQTPVFSANTSSSSQARRTKEAPIVPKLPLHMGNQNACPKDAVAPAVESAALAVTEPQKIVAKRWKGRNHQQSRINRKANRRILEPDHQGRVTLGSMSGTSTNTSTVETVPAGCANLTSSPFKTPVKTAFVCNLATSTPCRDELGVASPDSMLVSWKLELPSPKLEDMFNCSLLKSPSGGFAPLQETAQMMMRAEGSDIEELLGFSPLRDTFLTDTLGFDQQNEGLAKIFSDFSMPNLEEGIDMTNLSWS